VTMAWDRDLLRLLKVLGHGCRSVAKS
jgi:hypothetical protein